MEISMYRSPSYILRHLISSDPNVGVYSMKMIKLLSVFLFSLSLMPDAAWAKGPPTHAGSKANQHAADLCQLFSTLINRFSNKFGVSLTLPAYCTTYAIGDTGPAGGTVFYVSGGGLHGMEVAPKTESWAQWGCYDEFIGGAFGTDVGTGASNTQAIVASCGADTAAGIADNYELNGYTDWFLPSRDELEHWQEFMVNDRCILANGGYNFAIEECTDGSLLSSTTTPPEVLAGYPLYSDLTNGELYIESIRLAWMMVTVEFGNIETDKPFKLRNRISGFRIVREF